MINFVKYQGTGNDFILIDDRLNKLNLRVAEVKNLCDRHLGIGADGLIQIRSKAGFDFEMVYFNSDGNIGSMCGNGGRCAISFAHSLGIVSEESSFFAFDGAHKAILVSPDASMVRLKMNDVQEIEISPTFVFMNTGSPHFTTFRKNVSELDVVKEGRSIRNSERFVKEGTNVNFVEQKADHLLVRTYERGVEDETLSCGTGVTASVLSAAQLGMIESSPGNVETPGGKLRVYFKKQEQGFSDIWLEGPVKRVFQGELQLYSK